MRSECNIERRGRLTYRRLCIYLAGHLCLHYLLAARGKLQYLRQSSGDSDHVLIEERRPCGEARAEDIPRSGAAIELGARARESERSLARFHPLDWSLYYRPTMN